MIEEQIEYLKAKVAQQKLRLHLIQHNEAEKIGKSNVGKNCKECSSFLRGCNSHSHRQQCHPKTKFVLVNVCMTIKTCSRRFEQGSSCGIWM